MVLIYGFRRLRLCYTENQIMIGGSAMDFRTENHFQFLLPHPCNPPNKGLRPPLRQKLSEGAEDGGGFAFR